MKIANFVLFQAAWFVAVSAAAKGNVWMGALAMCAVVLVHLWRADDRVREARFLVTAGLLGMVVDTLLSNLGAFSYPSSSPVWDSWIVPPWITALWVGFATLPRWSLAWLRGRTWLAALLGAIGGPLSFLAGVRLGAIAPARESLVTWIVLAIEYALLTPILIGLAPGEASWSGRPRRLLGRASVGAGVLVLLAAGLTSGCVGMDKKSLERELLAMRKNELVRNQGVQRLNDRIELEGEPWDVEYVWSHFSASAPPAARKGPIVFVHGTPAALFNWSILLASDAGRRLRESSDVYVVDVIGHGINRRKAPRYSFQICADHVRGFLERLDLENVTLVGQSYGGEFAWRAALDAPDRVAKLVLIDSSGYRRPDDGWLPEEEKLRKWPGAQFGYLLNSKDRLRPALQLHFDVPVDGDQLDEMYLLCDNAENWRSMTHLCRDENGTREAEISRIAQPTLLVWGAKDVAYSVETYGMRFARDIAGSRLVIVPGAGHYPHEERPDAVAEAIQAFHAGMQPPR